MRLVDRFYPSSPHEKTKFQFFFHIFIKLFNFQRAKKQIKKGNLFRGCLLWAFSFINLQLYGKPPEYSGYNGRRKAGRLLVAFILLLELVIVFITSPLISYFLNGSFFNSFKNKYTFLKKKSQTFFYIFLILLISISNY